jgi:two-component system response regulator PilR (NtrC family)
MFKILVVDDEETVRQMLLRVLCSRGYQVDAANDGLKAKELLAQGIYDLVITDLKMIGISGMDLLKFIKETSPPTDVMMMTGFATVEIAVEAMKEGACDFITKPFTSDELLLRVKNVLEKKQLERKIELLESEFEREYALENIVGRSKELQRILDTVRRVAPSESTVLITGETGTGKELIAKAIHNLSRRAHKPFVSVNCAAFPEHLLESELFGHVKGAFTGATANRKGLIEEATGGTFFLDEVGTMPVNVQAKLLRVLEDKTIRRLGENKTIQVDARLVTATNQDLDAAIAAREFREDLYYRLNVVSIHVPPLRARRSDIPLLAEHFLRKYCEREDKQIQGITSEAMRLLLAYSWPGNVRELKHMIEQAVAMSTGSLITPEMLPPHARSATEAPAKPEGPVARAMAVSPEKGRVKALDERERELILEAIEQNQGNLEKAAKDLGISRVTLWRRMKKYGIRGTYKVFYG